jgi:GNAT superfamily N-acetyltransferase
MTRRLPLFFTPPSAPAIRPPIALAILDPAADSWIPAGIDLDCDDADQWTPWHRDQHRSALERPGAFGLVATIRGMPAGYILGTREGVFAGRSLVRVERLAVKAHEPTRRLGVGRELLRAAEQFLPHGAAGRLISLVPFGCLGMQCLLRAEGWTGAEQGRSERYFFQKRVDAMEDETR